MVDKKIVSKTDVDKNTLEKVYEAWGTTRTDHLAKMMKFIEREKAGAGLPLAETPIGYIGNRAAVVRPAALKSVAYRKAKEAAARYSRKTLADRIMVAKKPGRGYTVAQLIKEQQSKMESRGVVEFKGVTRGRRNLKKFYIDFGASELEIVDQSGQKLLKAQPKGLGVGIVKGKSGKGRKFRGGKGRKF